MIDILSLYLQKQIKIIKDNLLIATKNFDVDAIHDFRVGVKKVKALYLFADDLSNNSLNVKKKLSALRKLFKTTGNLRDIQVQIELLCKYKKKLNIELSDFNDYFHEKEKYFERKSDHAIKNFKLSELDKLQTKYDEYLSKQKEDKIFNKAFEIINKRYSNLIILSQHFSNIDDIHKLRIRLKEFIHIFASLNKDKKLFSKIPVAYIELKRIGEILGTWHDKIVFKEYIDDFMKKYTKKYKSKKDNYNKLLKKIIKDIDNDLSELDNKLKEVKIIDNE